MRKIFEKIKIYFIRAVIIGSLSAIVFLGVFYLVNLDIRSAEEPSFETGASKNANADEEIAKRLGATSFGMENYGSWAKRYGLNNSNNSLDADPDEDELPNYLEYVHGINPLKKDSDGDSYADKIEIANGYDPDASQDSKIKPVVEISIAKVGVFAPMIWSRSESEKTMLAELENGVGHYFKTASPGQKGNMVVYGHSSNYIWAKGNYNHIFKDLNNLEKGDEITISSFQKNGRIIAYKYRISEKFISAPDDERIFAETENQTLTLSTCWPLGTTFRRLIIKAELEK